MKFPIASPPAKKNALGPSLIQEFIKEFYSGYACGERLQMDAVFVSISSRENLDGRPDFFLRNNILISESLCAGQGGKSLK